MSGVTIILTAVCVAEAGFICFLLFTMNKIMEAAADYREPLEPIYIEKEDDFDD